MSTCSVLVHRLVGLLHQWVREWASEGVRKHSLFSEFKSSSTYLLFSHGEWVSECVSECVCVCEWVSEWVSECMSECMSEWCLPNRYYALNWLHYITASLHHCSTVISCTLFCSQLMWCDVMWCVCCAVFSQEIDSPRWPRAGQENDPRHQGTHSLTHPLTPFNHIPIHSHPHLLTHTL
jgi:hypothetical protein